MCVFSLRACCSEKIPEGKCKLAAAIRPRLIRRQRGSLTSLWRMESHARTTKSETVAGPGQIRGKEIVSSSIVSYGHRIPCTREVKSQSPVQQGRGRLETGTRSALPPPPPRPDRHSLIWMVSIFIKIKWIYSFTSSFPKRFEGVNRAWRVRLKEGKSTPKGNVESQVGDGACGMKQRKIWLVALVMVCCGGGLELSAV